MNIKSFILMTVACLSGGLLYGQGAVFVKYHEPNTYYTGNGTSWDSPFDYISQGINALGENGGTVYVKVGLYQESNLVIPANVTIKGGYMYSASGTDTTMRNFPGENSHWTDERWCTIITAVVVGMGSERIATVYGTIDGCVVKNGFTNSYGGGLLIDGGIARHCVIKACDAIDDNRGQAQGGGAFLRNNAQLINCVITECRADDGAAVAGSNSTLINNTITNNYAMNCGNVRDYDGNVYKTVVIGKQCWLRENLRTIHFADGTPLTLGTIPPLDVPSYYFNPSSISADVLQKNGYMYNWAAVMNGAAPTDANPSGVQGVCPNGWHIPSYPEVQQMLDFLQSDSRYWCGNSSTIVKALSSTEGWGNPGYNCVPGSQPYRNNASRFSAYPAWSYGSYFGSGDVCYFTTTAQSNGNVRVLFFSIGNSYVEENYRSNQNLYPVRCLKNY